jgi:hypothetical protein
LDKFFGFGTPFDLFKEKKFSSLGRNFWELERSKMEESALCYEKQFCLNRSWILIALPKLKFLWHK